MPRTIYEKKRIVLVSGIRPQKERYRQYARIFYQKEDNTIT
jgi:hypothetical protein